MEMLFKEKVEAFRESCRAYKSEKQMLENNAEDQAVLLDMIRKDVSFVEKTFETIMKKCGPNAGVILWKLFVEDRTQDEVAYEINVSRRKIQYSVNRWLHMVFEDDPQQSDGE